MSVISNQTIEVAKDSLIFSEGEAGDCAYVIETGRVLVYLTREGVEVPLSILGVGEIFGEMSLIDSQNRSASVRALEDVRLSVVNKEQLLRRIYETDSVVQLLMKVLLKRLRLNNENQVSPQRALSATTASREAGEALNQLKIENEVHEAFQKREFALFYQPIVSLESKKVVGCEALLRWLSPEHGMIAPDIFVDVIEASAMVIPIGKWIIEQAMIDLKKIQNELIACGEQDVSDAFQMSINISGQQFVHPQFLSDIDELSRQHGVFSSNIKLEVTERIMLDGSLAIDVLEQCRNRGYSISIDDFGTGFSSLQYLAKMPIDVLKIDRSFVAKMFSEEKSHAVVKSVIYLAHALKLNIIAEGIETEADMQALKELGVQYGQGFLFSKAVNLGEFLKKLK